MEYNTFIFRDDEKVKIIVHQPILTPEEYERRLNKVKKSAAELVKCAMRLEGQKGNDRDTDKMEIKKN